MLLSKTMLFSALTFGLLVSSLPLSASSDFGIEVTGQASIEVMPDEFTLTLMVTERGHFVDKLKILVDKKSNAVVSIARNLNIKSSDISTARVSLRTIDNESSINLQSIELNKGISGSVYIDGQNVNQQIKNQQQNSSQLLDTVFELNRSITINFNTVDGYDRFIGQVAKLNVAHIAPLSLSVQDSDFYYQQALLSAIEHAKNKAHKMAKKAGITLDKIKYVKETSSNHYRPVFAQAMSSQAGSYANRTSHQTLIGKQTITARVLIKYNLEK